MRYKEIEKCYKMNQSEKRMCEREALSGCVCVRVCKDYVCVCVCVLRSPNEQIVFNKYLPGSQKS